jgi:hypothetical protein
MFARDGAIVVGSRATRSRRPAAVPRRGRCAGGGNYAARPTADRAPRVRQMIRTGALALCLAGAIVAVVAVASSGTGSKGDAQAPAIGPPPPEWVANAGAWPAHNHDLSNTRATTQSPINSQTVSKLKVKWRFPFSELGVEGVLTSAVEAASRPRSASCRTGPGSECGRRTSPSRRSAAPGSECWEVSRPGAAVCLYV